MLAISSALLLSGCGQKTPAQQTTGIPYTVQCKETLPTFTLGNNSTPTKEQEAALCSCIWNGLGGWEQKAARAIAEGRENSLSFAEKGGFPSRFGAAAEKCGAMKL